jgi:hypothetical protein
VLTTPNLKRFDFMNMNTKATSEARQYSAADEYNPATDADACLFAFAAAEAGEIVPPSSRLDTLDLLKLYSTPATPATSEPDCGGYSPAPHNPPHAAIVSMAERAHVARYAPKRRFAKLVYFVKRAFATSRAKRSIRASRFARQPESSSSDGSSGSDGSGDGEPPPSLFHAIPFIGRAA